jgi:hypothetical protein
VVGALLLSALLAGCGERIDYDAAEVAPEEHMYGPGEHAHHHHAGHPGESAEEMTGARGHVHAAGVRNHGTVWFFNQPWAARFIWGKMLRDSAILVALALGLLAVSRYVHSRRWN